MSRVLVAILAAVAAVLLVGGAVRVLDDRSAPPIVIRDPALATEIVVVVEGAVATPGVYTLPVDARYQDAVAAAGGLTPDADIASVNMARRVRDEDRIVVPVRGVGGGAVPEGGAGAQPLPPELSPAPSAGRIDLNSATAAQLDELPGIGEVLAQRIVGHREANGPFQSVDDLSALQGISRRLVDELRPLVTVGP